MIRWYKDIVTIVIPLQHDKFAHVFNKIVCFIYFYHNRGQVSQYNFELVHLTMRTPMNLSHLEGFVGIPVGFIGQERK